MSVVPLRFHNYFYALAAAVFAVLPATSVSHAQQVSATLSGVDIGGNLSGTVVDAGGLFELSADYQAASNITCLDCTAQVVVGLDETDRACLYDGQPGFPGASGSASATLTAPCASGVYTVRAKTFQEDDCDQALAAWDSNTDETLLGAISVAPIIDAACGDIDASGTRTATDALGVLIGAVGGRCCDKCICDVDGSDQVTATDALAVLLDAVGVPGSMPFSCADTCAGDGGVDVGESRWFLGAAGRSCDTVCSARGLDYDTATRSYAGSEGTLEQCTEVLGALGVTAGTTSDVSTCDVGEGCISYADGDLIYRCDSPDTTSAAASSLPDAQRVCACSASRCGDGVVEGGEECDDANRFGRDGCESDCRLAGVGVGGAQWILSDVAQSCDLACADVGLAYDESTRTFAGSEGTDASCDAVLDALDVPPGGSRSEACEVGTGCLYATDTGERIRCVQPATDGVSVTTGQLEQRACACSSANCGDGVLDQNEECDDGNRVNGDGCESNCLPTASCGNGILESGEECDDGNAAEDDGCGSDCFREGESVGGFEWYLGAEYESCAQTCANRSLAYDEATSGFAGSEGTAFQCSAVLDALGALGSDVMELACDRGEGCGVNAATADRFRCASPATDPDAAVLGEPHQRACACRTSDCGNGALDAGEECDDANLIDGDGCQSSCLLPVCGDSVVDSNEQCDDGNAQDGDGCDNDCEISHCFDRVLNADEKDVDCGGADCNGCARGAFCSSNQDCESGSCDAFFLSCNPASCLDGIFNGSETDVDCGGDCPGSCRAGQFCSANSDCISDYCLTTLLGTFCQADTCGDGLLNGDESDVDCGGEDCPGCASGQFCSSDDACASGVCDQFFLFCEAPSCSDGVKNGDETDVDCGGSCPPSSCVAGQACSADGDCGSGFCGAGICRDPSCDDGFLNLDETDIDCGGADCRACGTGDACAVDGDCRSRSCRDAVCAAASCEDSIMNGDETAVDCGGSACGGCLIGESCEVDADCQTNFCDTNSQCSCPDYEFSVDVEATYWNDEFFSTDPWYSLWPGGESEVSHPTAGRECSIVVMLPEGRNQRVEPAGDLEALFVDTEIFGSPFELIGWSGYQVCTPTGCDASCDDCVFGGQECTDNQFDPDGVLRPYCGQCSAQPSLTYFVDCSAE